MSSEEDAQPLEPRPHWWVDDDPYEADDATSAVEIGRDDPAGDDNGSEGAPLLRAPATVDEVGDEDDEDQDEFERLIHPRSIRLEAEVRRSVFLSLHGAYHALAERVEQSTRDLGLSASESAVIVALRRTPSPTIAWLRRETGLHASTMSTLLKRLEVRRLVERERSWDPRFVSVRLTRGGAVAADAARDVLAEIDDEIAVFVPARQRAGPEAILAAVAALSRPGRRADY